MAIQCIKLGEVGLQKLYRLIILMLLFIASGCSSESVLKAFSSDGCSLFPDKSLISSEDWCSCCFEHDIAYWRGGTAKEREIADRQLKQCVKQKTQSDALADLMFKGVRFGGTPYFYNWYRWGYGWSFDRKYQALTPSENKLADQLLKKYFASHTNTVCGLADVIENNAEKELEN